jgi:methionine aminopeptidase
MTKTPQYTKEAAQYAADFIEKGLSHRDIAQKYGKAESTIKQYSSVYKWKKARQKYLSNVNISMSDIALNVRNGERAVVWKRVGEKAQQAIENIDLYTEDQRELNIGLNNMAKMAQVIKMAFEGERIEERETPVQLRWQPKRWSWMRPLAAR